MTTVELQLQLIHLFDTAHGREDLQLIWLITLGKVYDKVMTLGGQSVVNCVVGEVHELPILRAQASRHRVPVDESLLRETMQ